MARFLIVGLGNIGDEYRDTRHNIGFRIVDALAASASAQWHTGRYGDIAEMRVKNAQLTLLKPSTYMNLSGNAVRYWRDQTGIDLGHLLIVVDDIALPLGTIRLRPSGSDAGHNGLKSIAQMLGSQAYPRLRFGVGHEFARGSQVNYVLGHFDAQEQEVLDRRVPVAVEAIKTFCLAGLQKAACDYNGDGTPKQRPHAPRPAEKDSNKASNKASDTSDVSDVSDTTPHHG